jgi:hypothetical protein
MQNLNRLEVDYDEYLTIKKNQEKNKTDFQEQVFGARKKLYVQGMLIATTSSNNSLDLGNLTRNQFNSFLGLFTKNLYKQFYNNPKLYYLSYDFDGLSRAKNYDVWNAIKITSAFYFIDIQSAYWQVAYKLGYIDEKMFKKYLFVDNYKNAKRFCISFLARQNKMTYTSNGEDFIIECNNEVLETVYKNIRNYLYSLIDQLKNNCTEWIEYNIDALSVCSKELPVVIEFFENHNINYKLTQCIKINDEQFLHGSKIKNYIR